MIQYDYFICGHLPYLRHQRSINWLADNHNDQYIYLPFSLKQLQHTLLIHCAKKAVTLRDDFFGEFA